MIYLLLHVNQDGFRHGRGATHQSQMLRRIVEECEVKKKKQSRIMPFIDFSKAFDSVSGPMMREILLASGIPTEIVKLVMTLYRGTTALVVVPDEASTDFIANACRSARE